MQILRYFAVFGSFCMLCALIAGCNGGKGDADDGADEDAAPPDSDAFDGEGDVPGEDVPGDPPSDDVVQDIDEEEAPPGPTTYFHVDPDYEGDPKDGSAEHPWNSLTGEAWTSIDAALASENVTVYFSAREAGADEDETTDDELQILRTDTSTHRLTLDGMSRYNGDDASPAWEDYAGGSRFSITAGYPINTGSGTKRSYVTLRGFKATAGVAGYGGQIIHYWGGDHVIIEHNILTHDAAADHGAALQFGYAHHQDSEGNGGCTDIVIRGNTVHDTYGECIYIGGSEDTGLPAHSGVLVENNVTYNCGVYGGQGDCIDPKDGITDLVIRGNLCHDGALADNVNGIPSSSPMTAVGNVIYNMPNKGISLGTFWGRGFSGSLIANNVIYGNGSDGIYIGTDSLDRPIEHTAVLNNTVHGNGGSGLIVGSGGGGITDITVINNLFIGNDTGIGGWGSTLGVITNNDVFGNTANYSGPFPDMTGSDGNISADPLFTDSDAGDFHLQTGSPAVDSGAEVDLDDDIEGTPRPQGGGFDMGAYEQ